MLPVLSDPNRRTKSNDTDSTRGVRFAPHREEELQAAVQDGERGVGAVEPGQHVGWSNVEVRQGDACRPEFVQPDLDGRRFDTAVSTFAISAMPDVRAAVENVHAALPPGGRFFVLDVRLAARGPGRVVAWCLGLLYRALAGWSGEDALVALRRTFRTVEVVGVPPAGPDPTWVFIAVATA